MSSGKNILIVANGEPVHETLLKKRVALAGYIIAADGGIKTCLRYGIKPDCIIGDLDSFDHLPQKDISGIKIRRINDQDTTDMQKALNYAQSLNPLRIDVLCAFGKRVDHTIGNIFILHNFTNDTPLFMHEDFGTLSIISPGTTTFNNARGQTVSLFALDSVNGLQLHGFQFPLEKGDLAPGFIGVSNKITRDNASITFKSGRLFLYHLEQEG